MPLREFLLSDLRTRADREGLGDAYLREVLDRAAWVDSKDDRYALDQANFAWLRRRWNRRGRAPAATAPLPPPPARVVYEPPQPRGPGDSLKNIFSKLGFQPVKACRCNAIRLNMNAWGPDGCREPENMRWIVEGVQDEAARRGAWARALAAGPVVREAVRWACRRAEKERPPPLSPPDA